MTVEFRKVTTTSVSGELIELDHCNVVYCGYHVGHLFRRSGTVGYSPFASLSVADRKTIKAAAEQFLGQEQITTTEATELIDDASERQGND